MLVKNQQREDQEQIVNDDANNHISSLPDKKPRKQQHHHYQNQEVHQFDHSQLSKSAIFFKREDGKRLLLEFIETEVKKQQNAQLLTVNNNFNYNFFPST